MVSGNEQDMREVGQSAIVSDINACEGIALLNKKSNPLFSK
jgi:hypothetical protein